MSYRASLLSNGSPHSGQNFGGLFLSSGSHPHLSQRYAFEPSGRLAPHSAQNFPVLTLPQAAHVQPSAGSGFLAPHSAQNLPVFTWPQAHFQPPQLRLRRACWLAPCWAPSGRAPGRCAPALLAAFMPMKRK